MNLYILSSATFCSTVPAVSSRSESACVMRARRLVQMGYNLLYSVWKYSFDADCNLFLKILKGDIKEEVYLQQITLQASAVPSTLNPKPLTLLLNQNKPTRGQQDARSVQCQATRPPHSANTHRS